MAREFVVSHVVEPLAEEKREQRLATLEERLAQLRTGFEHQESDLASMRVRLRKKAEDGSIQAAEELARVKVRQSALVQRRDSALSSLIQEPTLIMAGDVEFLAHALVLPSRDPEERARLDVQNRTDCNTCRARLRREYS